MLDENRYAPENLLDREAHKDASAQENANQAWRPEKVERPSHVAHEEANGDDVKQDADRARNTVMRLAPWPDNVSYRNFDDSGAIPRG